MYGDDRVRFCGQCSQSVYNLSAMTREEAEDLIRRTEGRLCVRFYKRRDGTILTKNCSVGLRSIKDWLTGPSAALITGLLTVLVSLLPMWWRGGRRQQLAIPAVVAPLCSDAIMGDLVVPASEVGYEVIGKLVAPVRIVKRNEAFVRERAFLQVSLAPDLDGATKSKTAVVKIFISEGGEVDRAFLVKGDSSLRDLAEKAALGWKFTPLRVNGVPVRVESTLTLRFAR